MGQVFSRDISINDRVAILATMTGKKKMFDNGYEFNDLQLLCQE